MNFGRGLTLSLSEGVKSTLRLPRPSNANLNDSQEGATLVVPHPFFRHIILGRFDDLVSHSTVCDDPLLENVFARSTPTPSAHISLGLALRLGQTIRVIHADSSCNRSSSPMI